MSTRVSTLPGGLRVVTDRMDHVQTVSLGLWAGAGARSERKGQQGLSHLLEHMAFKGTRNRTARQIAEEIEAVGGDLNAATSLENTAYYARVLGEDVCLGLDILGDIVQRPSFDKAELLKERAVILQEIAASLDSPEDTAFDLILEAAYPDQPFGRPILGTPESVGALGPKELEAYRREHYSPGNIILAAVGAVDHDGIVKLAGDRLSELPHSTPAPPQPARYAGTVRHARRPVEQTHLILACEALPASHADYYVAQAFSAVLGGGMSSRLFQEARENRGLCYSIYSFCWGFSDTGIFGIYAATGDASQGELMQVVAGEMERMASKPALESELSRVRAQMKVGLLMNLESSSARAEQLGRQLAVHGRAVPMSEMVARVEAVDAESVRRFGERLLTRSRPSFVAVGPTATAETTERLISMLPHGAAAEAE
ncbi:MAG: M16 family metallopeptidase [Hyphomicrobiales bacterium]